MPTSVLVIGGAGFIGSHTVDLLLARGYTVRILDALRPPVHPQGKKPAYLPPEAEFRHGDMRNPEDLLSALRGMDTVIHLAAYQDYLTDFSTFFHINTVGTALYPDLRPERQLRVHQWTPLCPGCGAPLTPAWTDEAQVNPHKQYAISKYTQE